jgi:hypothetical protein
MKRNLLGIIHAWLRLVRKGPAIVKAIWAAEVARHSREKSLKKYGQSHH